MDSDTKRLTHRNTSNGTAMATHTSPSQALVPQVNPAFDTFMVFETLPKELRHMIWRASFEPRRLWLWGNCLSLDAMTGRFLLVNWEANTEFSRAYHFMFLGRHGFPKGVLINPEKDTLHFSNGLRKVEEFGYRWPEDMAKIRYIEVCPDFESRRQHMWRSVNIGCLTSIRSITVSSILDRENEFRAAAYSGESADERTYDWESNFRETVRTLEVIRLSIANSKAQAPPKHPFPSPTIAGIFAGWSLHLSRLPVYFESSANYTHASYGRLASDVLHGQSQPRRIKWLRKDELWSPNDNGFTDYFENEPAIFAAIENARVRIDTSAILKVAGFRRNLRYLADGPDPAYDRFTDMAWHLMGPMRGKPTQFLEEVESYFSFLRDVPNLMDSQFLPVTGQDFLQANKHLKEILENPLVGVAATINGQFLRLHESCSVCHG